MTIQQEKRLVFLIYSIVVLAILFFGIFGYQVNNPLILVPSAVGAVLALALGGWLIHRYGNPSANKTLEPVAITSEPGVYLDARIQLQPAPSREAEQIEINTTYDSFLQFKNNSNKPEVNAEKVLEYPASSCLTQSFENYFNSPVLKESQLLYDYPSRSVAFRDRDAKQPYYRVTHLERMEQVGGRNGTQTLENHIDKEFDHLHDPLWKAFLPRHFHQDFFCLSAFLQGIFISECGIPMKNNYQWLEISTKNSVSETAPCEITHCFALQDNRDKKDKLSPIYIALTLTLTLDSKDASKCKVTSGSIIFLSGESQEIPGFKQYGSVQNFITKELSAKMDTFFPTSQQNQEQPDFTTPSSIF